MEDFTTNPADISKNNKRSVIYMNDIATLLQRILDNDFQENTYMVSKKNDLSTYELMLRIKNDIGSNSLIITLPTIFFKPLELFFNSVYSSLFNDQIFENDQIGEFLKIDD